MNIRTAHWVGTGALLALGFLGCTNIPKDSSRILVNVAGEKITKTQFEEIVKVMVGNEKQTEELLKSEGLKEQRNQLLDSLAVQKSIIQMAKAEGLDKDIQTQFVLEQSTAQLYLKTLVERRLIKTAAAAEPTEAELKALYDQGVAQRQAAGQTKDLPTFEQVKPQLIAGWKQNKQQERSETEFKALIAEMRQKYPVTFADGYKPTPQPGQP